MSGQPKPPPWVHEELVAIVDGPMVGQWYTATDWTERREAAARMVQRGQRPAAALTYADTGQITAHPHVPDAKGTVWSCHEAETGTKGAEAAEAAEAAPLGERDVLDGDAAEFDEWAW